MALEEYKRKRDFRKTPEPPPQKSAARQGFSYLIQKHDATRLHYDLRLELDGVLLSWAVTKGPSLNPADKRLAVRTEDHPLSYGSFEGTIPKGQYGGGTVMLWDRGTWEPEFDPHFGLQKGHLAFILYGERLKGAWDLVRMHGGRTPSDAKRENWLLIKKKDAEAEDPSAAERFLDRAKTSVTTGRSMDEIAVDAPPEVRASAAKSRLPRRSFPKAGSSAKANPGEAGQPRRSSPGESGRTVSAAKKSTKKKDPAPAAEPKPAHFGRGLAELMRRYPTVELATLVDEPPAGDAWLHEIKFDGYRLLAFLSEGDVRLRTRNGNDWTLKFPSLYAAVSKLKAKNAVLDMEAVVLDSRGKSSFQALQRALGEEGNAQSIQAFVFDLLHLDGTSLIGKPLGLRKAALRSLLKQSHQDDYLHYSDHVVGHGAEMYEKACGMELEGIVSKLADSPYEPGRQKSWLKIKCALRQEFVIIGFTAARRGARAIGALHLGYYGAVRQGAQQKEAGQLTYAGKVGTGFSMRDAQELYDRLVKLEIDQPPAADVPRSMLRGAQWVKPALLCEVSFTEWTGDGHIRHPAYHGLREDKPPQQVHMETPQPSADDDDGAPSPRRLPRRSSAKAGSTGEGGRRAKRSARTAPPARARLAKARRGRGHTRASERLRRAAPAAASRSPRRSSAKASSAARRAAPVAPAAQGDPPAAVPSLGAPKNRGALEILGVAITHPDRVIFPHAGLSGGQPNAGLSKGEPDTGLTKGQLAQYYAAASKWILADIAGHPLSVIRCPDGISGQCFFQRSPNTGLGADIHPFRWRHKGKSYDYFYIEDERGLMELVQMGSVELHPWGARAARIDYPDRIIFDLDPHESVPFDAVKLAAEDLRRRLKEKGLESFLKATGGKGLHVTAPLAEKNTWDQVKGFGAALAGEMVKDIPDAYIATMTKAKRVGKIFIDFFRNDYTATAIADYGVRARPGAPVAVPLEWSELRKLRAANQFGVADALARLKRRAPDPARHSTSQRLPR